VQQPLIFLWALLGLIWATLQISRRKLPHQTESHDKTILFCTYVITWSGILITIHDTGLVPYPWTLYLDLAATAVFVLCSVRIYWPSKYSKRGKDVNKSVSRMLVASKFLFAVCVFEEAFGVYTLYKVGYLEGAYNTFTGIAHLMNVTNYEIPVVSTTVYHGIIACVTGIASGTLGIGLASFIHGKYAGVRTKRQQI
jgi:hypothetical protein